MNRYFVPGLLLVGTLFFAYMYVVGPNQLDDFDMKNGGKGRVPFNQVQQLKKETEIKMGIKQQRADMNKRLGGPMLDPGKSKRNQFHKTNVYGGADPKAIDLDDNRHNEGMSLDQKMDEFLAKRQQFEEMADAQRKLYVESFVKEAESMGYKVLINTDLEIVSVEKTK